MCCFGHAYTYATHTSAQALLARCLAVNSCPRISASRVASSAGYVLPKVLLPVLAASPAFLAHYCKVDASKSPSVIALVDAPNSLNYSCLQYHFVADVHSQRNFQQRHTPPSLSTLAHTRPFTTVELTTASRATILLCNNAAPVSFTPPPRLFTANPHLYPSQRNNPNILLTCRPPSCHPPPTLAYAHLS